jgi:hypothetical protein
LQVLPFARQIIETIGLEHIVRLEKAVERVAGAKAEQPPQFRLGQVAKP